MNVEGGEHPEEEHRPNTSIAATIAAPEDNASDCNSVKSTTLVDLHACGICFQLYNDSDRLPKVLSCGHTNCLTCLNRWLKHGSSPFPTCAVCRRVTHRPIHLLPNNFQLLQVLRRMKLISTDHDPAQKSEEESAATADEQVPGITAVCEQIDEHMNEVASLLENQLDQLSTQTSGEGHHVPVESNHFIRAIEDASADLMARWDAAKRHLLNSKKMKTRASSSVPLLFAGFGPVEFLGSNHYDVRVLEDDPFDRIHDFLALESDTPPHAYSDFSLFGSESSHETAVSASETSSQANENFSNAEPPREDIGFSHISTVSGDFATYSYCELCQCRVPANRSGHRTHILGRRHQRALGEHMHDSPDGGVANAMRDLRVGANGRELNRRDHVFITNAARAVFGRGLRAPDSRRTRVTHRDANSGTDGRPPSQNQGNNRRRFNRQNRRNNPNNAQHAQASNQQSSAWRSEGVRFNDLQRSWRDPETPIALQNWRGF